LIRFLGADGVATLSDFMPVEHLGHRHALVRRIKVVRGEIHFRMVCAPKFDYGRISDAVTHRRDHFILTPAHRRHSALVLRCSVSARAREGVVTAEFKLRTGQTASFILEEADHEEQSRSAAPDYVTEAFKETMNYWLAWMGKSQYRGRWRETVNRSRRRGCWTKNCPQPVAQILFEPESRLPKPMPAPTIPPTSSQTVLSVEAPVRARDTPEAAE
jgi:hypothetical protein